MNLRNLSVQQGDLTLTAMLEGPADGPVLMLVHGFPDTPHSWDAVVPVLVDAGYRVLRPWLRGYTPGSVHPNGVYSPVAAGADLLLWRQQFPECPVHLVGHDWGAVAAMAIAASQPLAFASLCVLAIPPFQKVERAWRLLPKQLVYSRYMLEMQADSAPHRIVQNHCARLRELWEQWSPGWAFTEDDFSPVQAAFEQAGVAWAATRYYRSLFTVWKPDTRAMYALSRKPILLPTLALAGERDGCMQAGLFKAMVDPSKFPLGVQYRILSECGHFLHAEKPAEVAAQLLHFLK